MSNEEIKELEKRVNKLKFIASQKGGDLHDLVEDRLLTDFEDLKSFAEVTYTACKAWSDLNKELIAAKKG
ncbi:CCE_0567 family metalloprotein [Saccharicrinis aurantiacus]|uniref:CCE_0567 family metalloprotein n=1 Tax=Saccharicrinis aurantiacus TaxID=1849719 RepID=UPI002493C51D|nr:CCE_0567 family metalloprotein [Saccharicrinis aurantiacus]